MDLFFYIFASFAIFCSFGVIGARNPVHSVFFLILVFCFTSCVLLLLTVDFLSILFIVVYVGAIAVLFLFVVMMLNIKLAELTESFVRYLPLGFFVGLLFFGELWYFAISYYPDYMTTGWGDWRSLKYGGESILLFGEVLYTYYLPQFVLSGMILLLSMVGSICLTLNHSYVVKRQAVYKQVGRNTDDAVALYKFSVEK